MAAQGVIGQTLRLDAVARQASVFLDWWLGELSALVPARLRRALTPQRRLLVVEIEGGEAVLSRVEDTGSAPLGRIDLDGGEAREAAAALRAQLTDRRHGPVAVVFRLPRSAALAWRFQLPRSALGALAQALRYRIEAETPFRADEVLFDYRTAPGAGPSVAVQAVVVPRDRLERMTTMLGALGLTPDSVDVAGLAEGEVSGFNLLPHEKGGRRSALAAPLIRLLAVTVVGLLAAALVLPLEQRRGFSAKLEAELSQARAGAEAALALKAEVAQLAAEGRFLAEVKNRQPHRVVILEALSALLPDHTYLAELKVRGDEVQIIGQSAAAAGLIALIDRAPLFSAPKFLASVTQDRRSGRERFNLFFRIEEPEVAR